MLSVFASPYWSTLACVPLALRSARAGCSKLNWCWWVAGQRGAARTTLRSSDPPALRTYLLTYLGASLTPGSAHCTPGNRVARGGTQGGLNCLTHVLPRCLPTPTEEADGGGERLTGRSDPLGRRLECTDNPRTTAVDRRSTPSARADRQALLPMLRCPGLPGFP